MKLVNAELQTQLDFEPYLACEWIIEAPEIFTEVVQDLLRQKEGISGNFILSENGKIIDIGKSIELITNPVTVDVNDKRIINKLYAQLVAVANNEQLYMNTQELKKQIYEYVFSLEQEFRSVLSIEEDVDLNSILKAASVKYEVSDENLLEKICQYMKVLNEMLKIKLVICINLRSFLSDNQMQCLLEDLRYEDFRLLLIENQERSCLQNINRYIIDKDLCKI